MHLNPALLVEKKRKNHLGEKGKIYPNQKNSL